MSGSSHNRTHHAAGLPTATVGRAVWWTRWWTVMVRASGVVVVAATVATVVMATPTAVSAVVRGWWLVRVRHRLLVWHRRRVHAIFAIHLAETKLESFTKRPKVQLYLNKEHQ